MNKRWIALLLAGLTVLSLLAGCGKKEEEEQYEYIPTYHELKLESGSFENGINAYIIRGDVMYFYTYEYTTAADGARDGAAIAEDGIAVAEEPAFVDDLGTAAAVEGGEAISRLVLYRVNLDGTGLTRLSDYQQTPLDEGMEGYVNINAMQIDGQGRLWVLEQKEQYYYNLPDDFDPETDNQWNYYTEGDGSCLLRRLSDTGAVEFSVDLEALYLEQLKKDGEYNPDQRYYFWAYSFLVDNSGYMLVYSMERLMVISPEGELVSAASYNNLSDQLISLSDGRVAIQSWESGLKAVDPTTWVLQEGEDGALPRPENYSYVNQYYSGSGDYLYFYSSSSSLYGMKADGTAERLVDWLDCDVENDYYAMTVLSADRLATVTTDWNDAQTKCSLVLLDRTLVTPENRRTELTLATFNLNWNLRRAVKAFNRSNTEYRIRVKDYSEYSTEENYEAGLQKLSTEIISGDVPDILACSDLPIRQYAAKGLLTDLTPYIEADEALGNGGLVKSVTDACRSEDGELFYVASQFYIHTAMADKKVVGDITGLTPAEALDFYQNRLQPDASLMGFTVNRENLMIDLLGANLEHYVNWETGECTFDSGSFANLLEILKLAPEEIDDEIYNNWDIYGQEAAMRDGRQLLVSNVVSDWFDILYSMSYAGGDGIYVGMPDEDRQGSCFELYCPLAMSSKTKHKDTVWSFIREFLTNEEYSGWGLSMVQSRLDANLEEARKHQYYEDENGNQIEYPIYTYFDNSTGQQVDIYCLTDELYNTLMDLINNTSRLYDYDQSIMSIVKSEVDNFLKGSSSAQDVAAMIQNKVSLYVNENR